MHDSQTVAAPGEHVLLGAYVDPRMKRRVVALAARNDRTTSAEIRQALRRHLAAETRTPA
jgi:predicted transcriptional regulator